MWTRKTENAIEAELQKRKKKRKKWALIEPAMILITIALLAILSEIVRRGTTGQETPIEIMIGAFILVVPAFIAYQAYKSKKGKDNENGLEINECAICVDCHETQLFEGAHFCRDCGSKIEPISLWEKAKED